MSPDRRSPHETEVTFEFLRHVGPRFIHGGVTLRFEASEEYEFVTRATWPTTDNYENAVREAIEDVLLRQLGKLKGTKVVLERIRWDPINSSENGFRRAARAAAEAAFIV